MASTPTTPSTARTDYRGTASRDYGGLITREPAAVHAPATLDELTATIRQLRVAGTPWVMRGAGHSAGGQPLIGQGAVIRSRALTGIIADDGSTITVAAGTPWRDVIEHLAADGRRPPVVTDQLYTTVGGTLSVGGIGDTSHLDGLQIDSVLALTLVTPDGELHPLAAGDDLFRFALAGHGQLGALADVTLSTRRRPPSLAARAYTFPSLPAYLAAVTALSEAGRASRHAFIRGRMFWVRDQAEQPVQATIGAFAADLAAAPPAQLPGSSASSEPELVDLLALARADRDDAPFVYAPCAELVLPFDRAVAIWAELDRELRTTGIPALFREGVSVSVVAPGTRLPLSPLPRDGQAGVAIALRVRVTDEVVARKAAAVLRGIAVRALAAGGRLYAIGEEPDDARWLRAQYADVWPEWTTLKQRLDPERRCHPWHV